MFTEQILKRFSSTVYARIGAAWLSVRNINSGAHYEDVPQIAVAPGKKTGRVVAFGREAEAATMGNAEGVVLVNPFQHPRTVIADVELAGAILRAFLGKVLSARILIRPTLVLHVLNPPPGGLTAVERRALREAAITAGAVLVHGWIGRDLGDDELLDRRFPSEGELF